MPFGLTDVSSGVGAASGGQSFIVPDAGVNTVSYQVQLSGAVLSTRVAMFRNGTAYVTSPIISTSGTYANQTALGLNADDVISIVVTSGGATVSGGSIFIERIQ